MRYITAEEFRLHIFKNRKVLTDTYSMANDSIDVKLYTRGQSILHTPYCKSQVDCIDFTIFCKLSIYTIASCDVSMQNGILLKRYSTMNESKTIILESSTRHQARTLFNVAGRTYMLVIMATVIRICCINTDVHKSLMSVFE